MTLHQGRTRRYSLFGMGLMLAFGALVAGSVSGAAAASVGLGTADSFGVLAGAGVTNTGPAIINGDLGTCPTRAITGFPPGVLNGTVHAGDAGCLQAHSDLTMAYNDAAGRAPTTTYQGIKDLGGLTLTAGVYKADSFAMTGRLTLDARGDPYAVFVFQAGSTLITASNSSVLVLNGAQPCNVFWEAGSSVTLGVGSTFAGTILALTSITANTNATVEGRLLARNGAVTLDSNRVTSPRCLPASTATPSTSTSSTTPTVASSSTTTTSVRPTTTTSVRPTTPTVASSPTTTTSVRATTSSTAPTVPPSTTSTTSVRSATTSSTTPTAPPPTTKRRAKVALTSARGDSAITSTTSTSRATAKATQAQAATTSASTTSASTTVQAAGIKHGAASTSGGGNSGSGDSQAQQLGRTGTPVAWLVSIALALMTLGAVIIGFGAVWSDRRSAAPGGAGRA